MASQEWECEIAAVYRLFSDREVGESATQFRALYEALCSAPSAIKQALGEPCDEHDLDRMLTGNCLHDAAFALVGRAGLMVSRSAGGHAHATVIADGLFSEVSHEATSIPLAIGGALSGALAAWAEAASAPALNRATH